MTGLQWFSSIYGGLVVVVLCAGVAVWRRSQPAGEPALDGGDLTDVELAALHGGPRLAAIAAATALRRSHVTQTFDGTLVARGPLVDDAGELERELFAAVRERPGQPAKALVDDAARGDTAARIVAQLQAAGLRLGDDASFRMSALWMCARALIWGGAVGAATIWSGGPRGLEALAPAGALVAGAWLLARWLRARRGASAAGRRLLDSLATARRDELRGVGGHVPFAVAILGAGALWTRDSDLAAALDVPRLSDTSFGGHGSALDWQFDWGDCGGCGCGGCG